MSTRLLQVFLSYKSDTSGPEMCEVSIDKSKTVTCNCATFVIKASCKHSKFVQAKLDKYDGIYPFKFVNKVEGVDIKEIMKDEKAFREFVINNVKIEVM